MNQVNATQSERMNSQRTLRRQAAERVLARAAYLPPADRLLLQQVYEHSLSIADVARGRREPPRRLQRRMAKLLCRMRQPVFHFVAESSDRLPRQMRVTARRVVLEGMSLRRTAAATGLTLHQVRQHMRTVHALARR